MAELTLHSPGDVLAYRLWSIHIRIRISVCLFDKLDRPFHSIRRCSILYSLFDGMICSYEADSQMVCPTVEMRNADRQKMSQIGRDSQCGPNQSRCIAVASDCYNFQCPVVKHSRQNARISSFLPAQHRQT